MPTQMAVCAGLFLCLVVAGEMGAFVAWRADAPQQHAADGASAANQHGRQLYHIVEDSPYRPVLNVTGHWITPYGEIDISLLQCPVSGNSSSTFSPLGFEDDKPAAYTFAIVITLYMFLGLAIVCDSFFESALSAICEAMNLKDDVAGATWMAAGGSAPELATSVIGVFISRSDVGFGTIVGSAVFNVLFVIACCTFVAPNLKLTWWPLARDCAYYCFSLAMIVIFVSDLKVEWYEAVILLLMYVGYVTVMYYNERLEVWVNSRIKACREMKDEGIQFALRKMFDNPIFAVFLYGIIIANAVFVIVEIVHFNNRSAELPCVCNTFIGANVLPTTTFYYINLAFNITFIVEMLVKFYAYGFFGYWRIPLNCFDGALVFLIVIELILAETSRGDPISGNPTDQANDAIGVGIARLFRLLKFLRFVRMLRVGRIVGAGVANARIGAATQEPDEPQKSRTDGELQKDPEPKAEEEEEEEDDEPFNPFEISGDCKSIGGVVSFFFWLVGLPLSIAFYLTIPDCRREMFKKCWFVTFAMCISWIAGLSYIMVWMIERLGVMMNIPISIMGLFILAAGTSIPDCLSSVAVARRGHGDMAVSSSIGSNIFDVLIGLPVPWFIYAAIMRPAIGPELGPTYNAISAEGLAVMILMLFVMVALVITTIHLSGWILSVKLGAGMMLLYVGFLILALLLEDLTGPVIFPPCPENTNGIWDGWSLAS